MANKYVSFISDAHLLHCIDTLYHTYCKAKEEITKKKFYKNKVDTFKLTFDACFNGLTEEALIKAEVMRQIDKSINNSIGTFHEEILGGINGYEKGVASGFDIKAIDNSLFADIKNKHNTVNSSSAESLFQKLRNYADTYKNAKCYWVQILAKSSFNEKWNAEINGKEYTHSRVFKISGDRFYALLTKQEDALKQLYIALPVALADYMLSTTKTDALNPGSVLEEIHQDVTVSKRKILDQITYDNYKYYSDFDKL